MHGLAALHRKATVIAVEVLVQVIAKAVQGPLDGVIPV